MIVLISGNKHFIHVLCEQFAHFPSCASSLVLSQTIKMALHFKIEQQHAVFCWAAFLSRLATQQKSAVSLYRSAVNISRGLVWARRGKLQVWIPPSTVQPKRLFIISGYVEEKKNIYKEYISMGKMLLLIYILGQESSK